MPVDLSQSLNPQQLQAVTHSGHALCILAGAGSGKTRAITYRIYHLLLAQHVHPQQVLAVTFTNKAAREMRERVAQMLPGLGRQISVATFHSACARLLREHGKTLGLTPEFTIYDEEESSRLVAQLLEARGQSRQDARAVYRNIEQARNAGLGAEDMEVSDFDVIGRRARDLMPAYENALRQANATDFAGLLLGVVTLLEAKGEESKAITDNIKHLLVDEYQDTNQVQARLVFAIGSKADSVTVVGDDDQSIYAWRGASADNLLDFLHTFPGAETVRLEQNYRSTKTILEAANAVIEQNPGRLEKRLFSTGAVGPSIRIHGCHDERDEARTIVREIERFIGNGLSPTQIAVLYRTNAQSRPIEEALRRQRRPYRIVGGIHFYGRKEVKDLVAYLRLTINPNSDVDLLRVLNVPQRGIGDTTRLRLIAAARQQNGPICQVLDQRQLLADAGLKKAAQSRVLAFSQLLQQLTEQVSDKNAAEAVRTVALQSGMVHALEQVAAHDKAGSAEADERLQNIGALVTAAHDFVGEASESGADFGLTAFLEEAALATDVDSMAGSDKNGEEAVTLMTLHAAKGLEYHGVVMCGLEEGLFPQARDGGLEDTERLEEERRLCYVGITRARQQLTLTHASSRHTFGETHYHRRSRFIGDIPAKLLARHYRPAEPQPRASFARPRPSAYSAPATDIDMDFCPDFIDDDEPASGPVVGSRVFHATFGEGTVTAAEDRGPKSRLVIRFDGAGEKRVIAKYVSLLNSPAQDGLLL